jgi:SAM-dependent methyltransferase
VKPGTLVKVAREGSPRTRLRAFRDGRAAVRLAATRALLETGLIDGLAAADGPRPAADLAGDLGLTDVDLTRSLLELGEAYGLVHHAPSGWTLSRRGRSLAGDATGRAMVEGLGGYHLELYRDLPDQLRGGPGRDDLDRHAELIARVSSALVPFVRDAVVAAVQERRPQRVLDLGCGEGEYLSAMLAESVSARGVGLEADARVAGIARDRLEPLHGRAQVLVGSAPAALPMAVEALGGPADLVLLANVVYYVPPADRADFLREVAAATSPGGAVLVVTTVAEPTADSAHIGLLFRAQRVPMMLPTTEGVLGDLRRAGLDTEKPRRVTPGEPVVAVLGTRR